MTEDTPRIYATSLSDYNAGSLCGEWLDLTDYADADELLAAIGDMLKALDAEHGLEYGQPREEWFITDYEGFPDRFYSEGMGFTAVYEYLAAVADMDEERRQAYELFIENGDEPSEFDNRYLGRYGDRPYDDDYTATTYAEESYYEQYGEDSIPKQLKNHIDWGSMARDLTLSGDIYVSAGHVFTSR